MKKEIVQWLLQVFENGTPPPPDEWTEIKKNAQEKYLVKKKG
jgi:hypothetical protein